MEHEDEKIKLIQLEMRVAQTEKFIETISKDMHELKGAIIPLMSKFERHMDWEEKQVNTWRAMESRIVVIEQAIIVDKIKVERLEKEAEKAVTEVSELKKFMYKATGAIGIVAAVAPLIVKFI